MIFRAEAQPKAVPVETREDVQMDVKYILPGGFPVRQEQVHPLAAQPAGAQRRRRALGHLENSRAVLRVQLRQVRGMPARHHQYMTRRHRLNIHKCHASIVLVDE